MHMPACFYLFVSYRVYRLEISLGVGLLHKITDSVMPSALFPECGGNKKRRKGKEEKHPLRLRKRPSLLGAAAALKEPFVPSTGHRGSWDEKTTKENLKT